MKRGILLKLGSLGFYLLHHLQVERPYQQQETIARRKQACECLQYLQIQFLPTLCGLDHNGKPLFGLMEGGDSILYNV